MWETEIVELLRESTQRLATACVDLATNDQKADLLRAVQGAQDLLDGIKAQALDSFDLSGGPADAGASSIQAWARQHLRLSSRQTGKLRTEGRTIRTLPLLRDALYEGAVRLDHVDKFSAVMTKVGDEAIVAAEEILVDLARTCDPASLESELRGFVDAVHPDVLDKEYVHGMEKRDLRVAMVGDGYAVTGFMDIPTGAKFKAMLDSLTAPADRDDTRSPAQRRMDNLDALLTSVLESGLPTRKGIRPQVHVTVDLERLQGEPGSEPARLAGWGSIGDDLLGYLVCDSDVTGVLTHGSTDGEVPQASILNVGRTQRLATPSQRTAIHQRQNGQCAAPGCHNVVLEMHHLDWWGRDLGRTDLDDLVGLCPRCHHLVHAGALQIERKADNSLSYSQANGLQLRDRQRSIRHAVRAQVTWIRQLIARAEQDPAHSRAA